MRAGPVPPPRKSSPWKMPIPPPTSSAGSEPAALVSGDWTKAMPVINPSIPTETMTAEAPAARVEMKSAERTMTETRNDGRPHADAVGEAAAQGCKQGKGNGAGCERKAGRPGWEPVFADQEQRGQHERREVGEHRQEPHDDRRHVWPVPEERGRDEGIGYPVYAPHEERCRERRSQEAAPGCERAKACTLSLRHPEEKEAGRQA
jgi:hypothetical protein